MCRSPSPAQKLEDSLESADHLLEDIVGNWPLDWKSRKGYNLEDVVSHSAADENVAAADGH